MPQLVPVGYAISSKVSNPHVDVLLSDEHSSDSTPADLAATKHHRVVAGDGRSIADSQLDMPDDSRPMWRRVFVLGTTLLLVILLIVLISIIATH